MKLARVVLLALVTLAIATSSGCNGPGWCLHGHNWIFKIGTDPDARKVPLDPVPTTIDALIALPHVERPPDDRRIAPAELTTFVLRDVELRQFQRAPDGDVHMVIADEHGHTMIIEAAPPFCCDERSPWRKQILAVRKVVDEEIPMALLGFRRRTISIAGPGYYDFLHAQIGVAPNAIELHPILAICFGRGCVLPDPRSSP